MKTFMFWVGVNSRALCILLFYVSALEIQKVDKFAKMSNIAELKRDHSKLTPNE